METTAYIPIEYKTIKIYPEQSTRSMLVMDEVNGIPLSIGEFEIFERILHPLIEPMTNGDPDICSMLLADYLTRYFVTVLTNKIKNMAFLLWEKGLYNEGKGSADMHKGNIMLAEKNGVLEIYNIDFGNYLSLDKESIISLHSMLEAISRIFYAKNLSFDSSSTEFQHVKTIIKCLRGIGTPSKKSMNVDWDAMEKKIVSVLVNDKDLKPELFPLKIFDIAFKYNLGIPTSIIAYFRVKVLQASMLNKNPFAN